MVGIEGQCNRDSRPVHSAGFSERPARTFFTIESQRDSSHCQGWSVSEFLGKSTGTLLHFFRSAVLPIQSFGDIQEQHSQLVDDVVLTLHLAPDRRMHACRYPFSQNSEFRLTGAIVSKAAILEESGSVVSKGSAACDPKYFTIEVEHVDCVLRSLIVDFLQVLPREEHEGIHYFQIQE